MESPKLVLQAGCGGGCLSSRHSGERIKWMAKGLRPSQSMEEVTKVKFNEVGFFCLFV